MGLISNEYITRLHCYMNFTHNVMKEKMDVLELIIVYRVVSNTSVKMFIKKCSLVINYPAFELFLFEDFWQLADCNACNTNVG